MTETVKKTVIGIRKMGVIMWCVAAIVGIEALHIQSGGEGMGTSGMLAMGLIAALGGVDIWKQGLLDKI